MAKEYNFRFTIRPAERWAGGWGILYGGVGDIYLQASHTMTLAAALVQLQAYSDLEKRSHAATLNTHVFRERKPPGFSKVKTTIYSEAKP